MPKGKTRKPSTKKPSIKKPTQDQSNELNNTEKETEKRKKEAAKAKKEAAKAKKKAERSAARTRLDKFETRQNAELTPSNSQNGGQSTENIKNKQIELVKATLRDAKSMAEAIFSQLESGVKAKLSGDFSGLSDEDKKEIVSHYEPNFQEGIKILTTKCKNEVHEAIFAELVKMNVRVMAEAIFSQLEDAVKDNLSGDFNELSVKDKEAIIGCYSKSDAYKAAFGVLNGVDKAGLHEAIFAELVKMNEAEKLFNEMVKAHKGADNKGADKGAASTVDITNGIAKRLTEQVQSDGSKHPARRNSLPYPAVVPAQSEPAPEQTPKTAQSEQTLEQTLEQTPEQTPSQPSARSWSKGQKGVALCLLGVGLGAMGTVAAHCFGVMNMAPVFGAVAMAFANPATLPFAVVGAALVAGLLTVAGIYLTKDQSSQTEIATSSI
jgi:hypothetical protein